MVWGYELHDRPVSALFTCGRVRRPSAIAVLAVFFVQNLNAGPVRSAGRPPIEEIPGSYWRSQQTLQRDKFNALLLPLLGPDDFYLFTTNSDLWPTTKPIRVAFLDGDQKTRAAIRAAATTWTAGTSVVLDFGPDPAAGKWYLWSREDTSYAGDIRISFNDPDSTLRYMWSEIGKNSRDKVRPNVASMNLQNLDVNALEWRGYVLHEFGHALGAYHENQSPTRHCDREIRWDNDSAYTLTYDKWNNVTQDSMGRWPGMFTVFRQEHGWDSTMTRRWLSPVSSTSAFRSTLFDSLSIMKYFLNAAALYKQMASPCFAKRTDMLSRMDISGMRDFYPRNHAVALARAARIEKLHALVLKSFGPVSPSSSP